MPKSQDSINQDLEELLVAKGYDVTPMDSSGKELPVASEAELFQFHFHRNGKDYGSVTITIDGLQKLTVYYDDEIASSGGGDEERGMNGTSWISLVKQLKKFAQQHQLGFTLKDTDRLRSDMQKRVYQNKLEEGKVKQLADDLELMSESSFKEVYGITKSDIMEVNDYFKRRQREEDIISGKKPARKKAPAKTSDYAKRREQEKKEEGVTEGDTEHDIDSLQKNFDHHTAYDAASHGPSMMQRKNKEGKLKHLVRQPNGNYKSSDAEEQLNEGYYGNKKMSYSEDTPTVKMIIKHDKTLEETDQRFRHIDSIFLETSDGERFKAPTKKPSRARAFARHIAEGGAYKDDRWNHITEMCNDLDKLRGFVSATRGSIEQFNESAQRMISEATEQYQQLKESLKRISGSKGYNKYFESYEPKAITEDDDADLAEAFMHNVIDNRIEEALPVLNKFGIKIGKINEAEMFEDWADNMIDEALGVNLRSQMEKLTALLSDELPTGPNGSVAIGELKDIIESDDLYDRLRNAASVDANSDARPQIIAWMQEQDNPNYREVLQNIKQAEPEPEQEAPPSSAPEPAPEAPEPEQEAPPAEMPQDDENIDLSGMPPLKEDALESLKRLLKM